MQQQGRTLMCVLSTMMHMAPPHLHFTASSCAPHPPARIFTSQKYFEALIRDESRFGQRERLALLRWCTALLPLTT